MTTDNDLVELRISIARAAQRAGVETERLKVLGKNYEELRAMARYTDHGWHELVGSLIDKLP